MTDEVTNVEANKIRENETVGRGSVALKTMRLSINFVTNILIVLIVFVCMVYAISGKQLSIFQLHIIFCVLGYQIFMTQGTLVLSKYNSWSIFLSRKCKIRVHWILQIVGVILASVGSCIIIAEKSVNFNTAHGITGLLAMITSLVSLINGLSTLHVAKLSPFINAHWIKFIHYVTGVGALFLSAVCLCLGFHKNSFKSYAGDKDAIILMICTCLFTFFVAIEFWINLKRRILNRP